jgi:hypothetical protein
VERDVPVRQRGETGAGLWAVPGVIGESGQVRLQVNAAYLGLTVGLGPHVGVDEVGVNCDERFREGVVCRSVQGPRSHDHLSRDLATGIADALGVLASWA